LGAVEEVPWMPPRYPADARFSPRALGDASRALGLDDDGERCPQCPLKQLCESETRWLVCRTDPPRYLN
jgi:hypothetical protein